MTTFGTTGQASFYVNNSGTWTAFNHYEFFKVKKKQNQISEFEVKVYDITNTEKAYFKERAEVMFFVGTTLLLKGRIQNIEYEDAYGCVARGFGMEVVLLDKEFIKNGDNRVQYSNSSAQTIAKELVSTNADGSTPWIINPSYKGIFNEDYGNLTLRYEYANNLNAIAKLSDSTSYDWWVDQFSDDDYDADYIFVSPNKGLEEENDLVGGSSTLVGIYNGSNLRVAQKRFLIGNITRLGFKLQKNGSPTGNITFAIRKVSDDSVIQSKVWGDASTLSTGYADTWREVTFDSIAVCNEEVYLSCEYSGGDASNFVQISVDDDMYLPNEQRSRYVGGSWIDVAATDVAYKITFSTMKSYDLSSNAVKTSQEKDLNNVVNYVKVLGYGDGINQLKTSTYAASTASSILYSTITSTASSITINDVSSFSATGSARISEEILNYAGTGSNTLTGCTRGVSSSTATSHSKGAYIEQYFPLTSSQSGSSISTYGIMDHTLIDRTIINEQTAELISSKYLTERKTPIERIKLTPDEPLTDATLRIGDRVVVTDAEANISGTYKVVGLEFVDYYGDYSLELEVSNRNLDFIEQVNKAREEQENMAKYMQGATNIYSLSEAENCDGSYPLNMRFYIPTEAVAINKVLLNFKLKNYRAYESSNADGGSSTPTSANTSTGVYTNYYDIILDAGTEYENSTLILLENFKVPGTPLGTFDGCTVTVTLTNRTGNNQTTGDIRVKNNTTSTVLETQSSTTNDNNKHFSANFDLSTSEVSVGDELEIRLTNAYIGTNAGGTAFGGTYVTVTSKATHTHDVTIAAHTHTINYGIYEETLTSPSVVLAVGTEGSETTVDTYTEDQAAIDITDKVTAVGAGNWCNIKFTPNKRMRIEANAYVQIFLESK
jgi:hypothetical protein